MTFRLHRSRLWWGMALLLAPVILLIRGLLLAATAAAGVPVDAGDLIDIALSTVVVAVAGATGAVLGAGRRLGWVRTSPAGVEFASTRMQPAFLPWDAVRSVRLRRAGPLTQLVIAPTSPDAVRLADGGGRPPRAHRIGGVPSFVVDVGMMKPGPTALLAELNRQLSTASAPSGPGPA